MPGSADIVAGNLDVEGLADSTIVIDATDPASATVTINGNLVFSGAIPDGGGVVVNEPEGGTNTVQIATSVDAVLNGGAGSDTFKVTLSGTGTETVTVNGDAADTLAVQGPAVADAALALTASSLTLQNTQGVGGETVDYSGMGSLSVGTAGTQTYAGAVVLGTDTTLFASDVTFATTIDGAYSLTVDSTGTATFDGLVGGLTALESLTTLGAGSTVFDGGGANTSAGQSYGTVALGANTAFATTAGGSNPAGSGFTLGALTGGGFDLSLDAGTAGAILAAGVTGVSSLTVVNSGSATFTGAVSAATADLMDSTGTIAFQGDLALSAGLITAAQPFNVVIAGASNTIAGATNLVNTGYVALGQGGAMTLFAGGLATTAVTGGTTVAGTVTTTDAALTLGAVTLAADVVLGAGTGTVRFDSTVDGADVLTVNSAAAFAGAVGGLTPLASLVLNAAASLGGGSVTTRGTQTFAATLTLVTDTTLTSNTAGNIDLGGPVDGAFALTVNTAGTTTLGAAIGAVTALASVVTDAPGTTVLDGGTIRTTGKQTFRDAVTLGADTTLASTAAGDVSLGGTVDGGFALAVNTAGGITLAAALGGNVPLASFTTDAPGTTLLSGGTVKTTGAQAYSDAVTLGADTILTSTAAAAVTLAGTVDGAFALTLNTAGTTTFGGALGGATPLSSLTTDAPGSTAINGGLVKTSGAQTYGDSVTLGADTTLASNSAGNVNLKGTVDGAFALTVNTAGLTTLGAALGSSDPLASVTTDAAGATALQGGTVKTLGAQTYGDSVTLGADTALISTAGGSINLAAAVDGAFNLAVETAGTSRFGGAVGGLILLASVTTDAPGSTALDGGTVTTSGAQNYNDSLHLGADTTLRSTGAGDVALNASVDGAFALTVETAGTTRLGAALGGSTSLTSFTTDAAGSTALNGGVVRTTGSQTYGDAVTLGADTTLTSTGANDIDLKSSVDGAFALTVNTGGTTHFRSALGGTTPLASLATDTAGVTVLDDGLVVTSGGQTYNDSLVLGADTILTSTAGGGIRFNGTVDGPFALTVNTGGTTQINAAIGGIAPLTNLVTDAPGTTAINGGSVTTSADQDFQDAVVLGAAAVLTSTAAGDVIFGSTVDGPFGLVVNTAGTTSFGGALGSAAPLASLTTDAPGTTAIRGGSIKTSGAQSYNDAITLGAAAVLTSTTAGAVVFGSTVDGTFALTVNTAGTTTLTGAVGGVTPLASLTTDAAGATILGGGLVQTSGAQAFRDAITLGAATTVTSTAAGDITFGSAVNGAFALAVNTAGIATFAAPVGDATPLASLTTDAPGFTALSGVAITTSGAQTFNDAITLGAATVLTSSASGDVTFVSTIDGAFALVIATAGDTHFGGAIGGTTPLASLTTDAPGSTTINGGVIKTAGAQAYGDPVSLGAAVTLTSTGAGTINLAGTVNGAFDLTINTAGTTALGAALGGATLLASVTTDAPGTTVISGVVNTSGAQHYNDALTLGSDTILTSTAAGDVAFGSTVDGPFTLVVNTAGNTSFNAAVGNLAALASIHTDAPGRTTLKLGTANTTGAQNYDDPVTLAANTTLASSGAGDIVLAGTVDGPFALAVNTAGTTRFGGAVGGGTALAGLATNAAGSTWLAGGVIKTSGAQAYNDPIILAAGATLTSTGAQNITFASTVDGSFALTLNTTGLTTFAGPVGNATALASLTTDAAGSTAINGGAVTTAGAQTYNDPVTLGSDTTLASAGGNISFWSTVNDGKAAGTDSLTVTTQGTATFAAAVGGTAPLASLTTQGFLTAAIGTTVISGGSVTTTGAQSYNAATLTGTTTLRSTVGANISFRAAAAWSGPLTVATSGGNALFTGAASGGAGADLTVNAGAGSITFGSTVNGAFSLYANSAGVTSFGGAVGTTTPLVRVVTDQAGRTDIGASMSTTGDLTFNDPVYLLADVILTDAGAASTGIRFNSTVDSNGPTTPQAAFALTVISNSPKVFNGPVGSLFPLSALVTKPYNPALPSAPTQINGGSVTTTGDQNYYENVVLGSSTTLNAGGATAVTGTVTGAPGADVTLTIVGGSNTSAVEYQNCLVNLVVELQTGTSPVVKLGQAKNEVSTPVGTSATIFGGGSSSTNTFKLTTTNGTSGGAPNGGTAFSGGPTNPPSGDATNLTLVSGGGDNTIDLTQTPLGVALDLRNTNGHPQPLYNQALTNPNTEEQGLIAGFSGTFFSSLQNSSLSLVGAFQTVVAGSNNLLFAAPSPSNAGGDSPPQPGSLIVLTGENNVVQGAQGSTILAFSNNNQVVQNTTASDQSQINAFLASNVGGLQAYLSSSTAAQQAYVVKNAAGLSAYLLKSPTGSQAFLQQSKAALSAYILSNPTAQQAYLQKNATSLAAYLVRNSAALSQYLSGNAAGFAAYLASNPAAQQAYLIQNGAAIAQYLVGNAASQQAYVLSNTAGLAAFLVKNPAAVSAFIASNPSYTGGVAGLQSYLIANPSALQQFVTSSSTGLAAYLSSNPASMQAFLAQNGAGIAQFLVGNPPGLQAYLRNNNNGISQYVAANPSTQQAFLQQDPDGFATYLLTDADALSAYLGSDPAALEAYQQGGNSGLEAYLQGDPVGLQQYIAANPTVLSKYLVINTDALFEYLSNNPSVLPAYLAGDPAALGQYLNSNPTLLGQYLANTTVLDQYIASTAASIQQFLLSDPTTLAQFVTSNPTVLQQLLTTALGGNAAALQQYLAANPDALSQYLGDNPGALQQFLSGDPQALVQFLEQPGNAGILAQFLNASTLDLFRLKVTVAGDGNEVTGGLLASFTMGSGSFIEQVDPVQFQNLVVPGVASGIDPSAFALNVTMTAGANVVVGGLLGNFTSPGGNTRFVIQDPTLLGIPAGTFDGAISADPSRGSALAKIIQSAGSGGIFNGGGAGDTFYFVGGARDSRPNGSPFGHVVLTEPEGVVGGTLDFSNFRDGITLNLAQTTDQQVSPNTLWLTLPPDLTHVIGTAASDTITANNQDDLIEGAAFLVRHPSDLPGPAVSFRTQWVYLDFNTPSANLSSYETLSQWNPGGVYSAADRLAILQALQQIYAPLGSLIQFTLTPPTPAQAPNGYTTVSFNQTPLVDGTPQPGGHSSAIDWRNLDLTDTVQLDVNGFIDTMTSALPQPQIMNPGSQLLPDTHANFLNLSITIAAHEVGHTLGLEHQDAFGPIGFGITDPPGETGYNPSYSGFVGAFQSVMNVMASPASVGSSLVDAASGLINLGERSAILLSFIMGGTVFNGGAGSPAHNTYATALPVSPTGGLYTLNVPDPITAGFDADKSFDVAAVNITGHIGGTQTLTVPDPKHPGQTLTLTKAVPDYYSFYGQAGDVMNFQVMSAALARVSNPIDSVLRVYDPNGNLIATNDDNFESSDSSIVDLLLTLTGKYTVEISSYSANQDPAHAFFLDPNDPNYNPASFYGAGTGDYELLVYRFNAYNTTSGNDTFIAGSGDSTFIGGTGNDTFVLGTGTASIDGGGGVNTLRASGDGNFSLSGNAIIGATGGTGTFRNIQQVALADTGAVGGHTFTIQPSWAGPVTISGPSGRDTLLAAGPLNAQVTALSSLAQVTVAGDLAGTLNVGTPVTPANVGAASVSGNVSGTLNVTGNLGSMSVRQNVAGTIAVSGSIGVLNSPTGVLSVGGAVTKTGLISAGNLFGLTIGPDGPTAGSDLAGQIIVSSGGLLGDLRIAGGAPGTITAGRVGTIRVYAGYGPFVLQVNEAGVQRSVQATVPSAPFPVAPSPTAGALPNPLPGVTFQLFYEGLGSALVEGLSPNLAPTDPQLTARINHAPGSTAPDQFDLSLVAYHNKGAFNLARLDAGTGNGGITGVRNVAVEGSILTKVTQAASNFITQTTSKVPLAAGVSLPKDALAGVAVRDVAPAASISAKSVQAVAFGLFAGPNGVVSKATSATAANAAALLAPGTAIATAGSLSAGRVETFRVPFADLNPVAFFFASGSGAFNANRVLFSIQDSGVYPVPTANILARGSDVALVSASLPNLGAASVIQSIAVTGDNASIQTALTVSQSLTSTGPLGDVTIGGPLQANITAPSIFGSIAVNGTYTGTIRTTGLTTNPITGATSLIPADLGRVYFPSGKAGAPAVTTITFAGLAGQVISGGNLISQITASGGISGNIEAQGDLGVRVGTALLGGVVTTGPFTGAIVTLGNILGNTTINGSVTSAVGNPLSGVIAASGPLGLVGNLTVNGGFGGQLLTTGPLTGAVTVNGPMQKGRIAAQGGILGNLTVTGGLDAQSAIVSGGAIGSAKAIIKVTGANLGIIAAKGTINSGGVPLTGNVFTSASPNASTNAAAIDHIFAAASPPLSAVDFFDTTSPLDLVRLKQLLKNLNALTVKGGVLDDSGSATPPSDPPADPVPPKTPPKTR